MSSTVWAGWLGKSKLDHLFLARSLWFHSHDMSRETDPTGGTVSWSRRQSGAAAQRSTHLALCFGSWLLRTRYTGTALP